METVIRMSNGTGGYPAFRKRYASVPAKLIAKIIMASTRNFRALLIPPRDRANQISLTMLIFMILMVEYLRLYGS